MKINPSISLHPSEDLDLWPKCCFPFVLLDYVPLINVFKCILYVDNALTCFLCKFFLNLKKKIVKFYIVNKINVRCTSKRVKHFCWIPFLWFKYWFLYLTCICRFFYKVNKKSVLLCHYTFDFHWVFLPTENYLQILNALEYLVY